MVGGPCFNNLARRLVPAEEVPDEALRAWFEDISCWASFEHGTVLLRP